MLNNLRNVLELEQSLSQMLPTLLISLISVSLDRCLHILYSASWIFHTFYPTFLYFAFCKGAKKSVCV